MRLKKDLVLRQVAGEYIVVPIGRLAQIAPMMRITESTAWLWEEMEQGEFSEESLIKAILERFTGVTEERARNDIHKFLELLDGNYMLDNGKSEPQLGSVSIKLTEEQTRKMKESMKK